MAQSQQSERPTVYSTVKIGRQDGDGPNYEVYALPTGSDFRDGADYDRFEASMLKIDGFAFAADSFDIGEHDRYLTIEQSTEGGMLKLFTDNTRPIPEDAL